MVVSFDDPRVSSEFSDEMATAMRQLVSGNYVRNGNRNQNNSDGNNSGGQALVGSFLGSRSSDSGAMRDIRRVLQEAQRTMGRQGRTGSGVLQDENRNRSRSTGGRNEDGSRATRRRFEIARPLFEMGSIPPQTLSICSAAVTRVNNMLRQVARRVQEGQATPGEMSRASQCAEIIFGIRDGFTSAQEMNVGRSYPRNREEMETVLLNRHVSNPDWQNDSADSVLSMFHDAIEHGNLVEMLNLIPRMIHSLSHRDPISGETALHVACLHGQEEILQILLDMGHHADPVCFDESTPLSDAASGGYTNIVRFLAMRTPHCINMADRDGDTPLHNAARGDHADVVRVLLEHGAAINERNKDGELPIDYSAEGSRCRRLLSGRLASVDGKDREVLNLFYLYGAEDISGNGFTVIDLISLSNNRMSPDIIVGALQRLMRLGAIEPRGVGETHWALASHAALSDRGLTYD